MNESVLAPADSVLGYDATDLERWVPEPPKRPGRSAFERDRARVLHSAGLRRLAAKTQVVGPGTDDFVRNRLTHSLEVAQVGRELGKALGCDPDVVDTACLAHDLGHPPFGHNGEAALAELAADFGGFEGNAQTLRQLTRLEAKTFGADERARPGSSRSVGLNLTRASLDASIKYPWGLGEAPDRGAKFGVYSADRDVFDWVRDAVPVGRRCIEAQVMDLADDIAYSVHDVEDAVVAGWLDLRVLDSAQVRSNIAAQAREWYLPDLDDAEADAAFGRIFASPGWVDSYDGSRQALAALKNLTSELIGRFCASAQRATRELAGAASLTRYAADLVVPRDTAAEIVVLKGVAAVFVMNAEDRQPIYARQQEVIHDVVSGLRLAAPHRLDPEFRADFAAASDDAAKHRVIIDQVAAMTDVSILSVHRSLGAAR